MSTTIDNKVVEMRFDNRNFEQNVGTTLSTLDKLKKALKLDNVSKGFDSVASAAKKVDMRGLQNGIETVHAKFSALDVVAITALSNITSAAMRAGKNIVSSFTVDPVISGFREYETQLNSVQTILTNTQSKGTTIDQVNAALAELNEYADKTIYNFTEMTRNIGTFTAAGVDLDTAVGSIKGIANLAAASGSSATQAATAMYQLSQAIATGRVSLMDWNSVVNAGMGGELFQNALKRTAENFGTNVDAMIKKYGSFRESLTQGGWLTTEVLTETLKQLSGAYSKADLIAQGFSESQADEITKMAKSAEDAATKVKGFTQLMDTLKEAAGSGWATTWQTILGDFEEAKEFFTGLSDYFSEMINASSDARNNLLSNSLDSNYEKMLQFLEKVGVSSTDFAKKLDKNLEGSGTSVEKLKEKFGTLQNAIQEGAVPAKVLTKTLDQLKVKAVDLSKVDIGLGRGDGFKKFNDDVADVQQALVNLGYDLGETGKKADGVDGSFGKMTENAIKDFQKLNDLKVTGIIDEKTLAALKKAQAETESFWVLISKLSQDLDKLGGRQLLLDSIMNIIKAIAEPLKAVKKAFSEVFDIDANSLYDAIKAFNKFTKAIKAEDETLDKITRTFKGVFGVIKIFTSLIGGGVGAAFKILTGVLENFNLHILDVTAFIGDVLYVFSDFITFGETAQEVFGFLGGVIETVAGHVAQFFKDLAGFAGFSLDNLFGGIVNSPVVKFVVDTFNSITTAIGDYISELSKLEPSKVLEKIFSDIKGVFDNARKSFTDFIDFLKGLTWDDVIQGLTDFGDKVRENFEKLVDKFKEIGPDIIAGLRDGLGENLEGIFGLMYDIGSKIIAAIKAVLGIHSPSTVMYEIGQNIVQGLINGISSLIGGVVGLFRGLGDEITKAIGPIDWGSVLTLVFAGGMFMTLYKFTDALQGFSAAAKNLTAPAAGIGKLTTSMSEFIDGLTGQMKGSTKLQNAAIAMKMFAEAIAIVAAAVGALTLIDPGKLWQAVGVIAAIAAIMGALTIALNQWGTGGQIQNAFNINSTILTLSAAFILLGVAAKIMGSVDAGAFENAKRVLITFGVCIGLLAIVTGIAGQNLDKAATFIGKIGTCFLLLSVAAKLLGGIGDGEFDNAQRMLSGFTVVVGLLILATSIAGNNADKAAQFISKIGTAFLMLSAVAKILGSMSAGEMGAAQTMLNQFTMVVGLLMIVVSMFEPKVDSVSSFLIKIAGAFALLAVAARLLGGMEFSEMGKVGVAIAGLALIMAGLVAATNLAPKEQIAKIGATLLAMSLAIGVLAGIAVLLGMVRTENLAKGIVAVGMLSLLMSLMVKSTKGAGNIKGTMIGIAVAMGVLAAAIAVLSFIDPGKLAPATAAMSAVMYMFSIVESQAGKGKKATGSILALTAAVAVIGGMLYLLSSLPIESTLASALSLSMVLLALAAAMRIMHGTGEISKMALVTIGVLTLVIGAIGGVLGLMAYFNAEPAISTAASISLVLFAIMGALKILETVNYISGSALAAMGILTAVVAGIGLVLGVMAGLNAEPAISTAASISLVLIAMASACAILDSVTYVSGSALAAMGILTAIVAGLGLVLGVMAALNVEPSIETAAALSILLIAMAGVTAILGAVGVAASAALAGAGAMMGVIAIIGGVVAAMGALCNQFEGIEASLDTGIRVMGKIGEAIGTFVSGIGVGLTSGLPEIADNLSMFGMKLLPFTTAMSGINPSIGETIANLGTGLLSLTAGGMLDQLTQFFGGKSNLSAMAEGLPTLGEGLAGFCNSLSGVNPVVASAGAQAFKTIAEAMSAVPNTGGLFEGLVGGKDYSKFGEGMKQMGAGVKKFADSTKDLSPEGIQPKVEALKSVIQGMAEVPNEGGLLGSLLGDPNYEKFAGGMEDLGDALKKFYDSTSKIENLEGMGEKINAMKTLITAMSEIPGDGSWIDNFLGDGETDYEGFATAMEGMGTAIANFAKNTKSIENAEDLSTIVWATKNLIEGLSGIEVIKGGLLDTMTDGEDFTSLGTSLSSLGSAMSSFANSLGDTDFSGITSAITACQNILTFINSLEGISVAGVILFKYAVDTLATVNIKKLAAAFEGSESVMKNVGKGLIDAIANGFKANDSTLTNAGRTVINNLKSNMTSAANQFKAVGTAIMKNIKGEIKSGDLIDKLESVLKSAKNAANDAAEGFDSVGANIGKGILAGMDDYVGEIAEKAAEMVRTAVDAANAEADSHSPSRVFRYQVAGYMGQGMVLGLRDYMSPVSKIGGKLGRSAIDGVSTAIANVASMVDADMDLNPTITPVLDLDNVKSGAGLINGMLASSVPVGVLRNVNSINRMMDRNIQNGGNDDVVSAIDKLRKNISDISGNSYTINGVTYDDGSAVARAVDDLARAMRLERRV